MVYRVGWAGLAALATTALLLLVPGTSVGQFGGPASWDPVNVRVLEEGSGFVTVGWDVHQAGDVERDVRPPPRGYRVLYRRLVDSRPDSTPPGWRPWLEARGGKVSASARSATIRLPANGVWYEVAVEALHDGGTRAGDGEVMLARPGRNPPSVRLLPAPGDFRAVATDQGSVTMGWSPRAVDGGAPVTGYEIWYRDSTDPQARFVLAETVASDAHRHTISGLVNYRRYWVMIAAVNAVGRGPFTGTWMNANREDFDPLSLIAQHRVNRLNASGVDEWEVWLCDVPDGDVPIDVGDMVALLQRELPPCFSWLSGGRYQPTFVEGGTVKVDRGPFLYANHYKCDEAVARQSDGEADGGLIVLDDAAVRSIGHKGNPKSYDDDGTWRVEPLAFGESGRSVHVAASTVVPVSVHCGPHCPDPDYVELDIVAHTMGHGLGWPHSNSGRIRIAEDGRPYLDEYDNLMDVMSQVPRAEEVGDLGLVAGTPAVNRYAAGWIDPEDVAVHRDEVASYLLAPLGRSGTQMLVIPTGDRGRFVTMGARQAEGYDAGIPAEGVEVYEIDQRAIHCSFTIPDEGPDWLKCGGTVRRTLTVSTPRDHGRIDVGADHVYGPGEGFTFEGFRIEVVEQTDGRYRVWVGNPYRGAFADDEGSVHERNIDELANRGITRGCDPDLRLYCPTFPSPALRWLCCWCRLWARRQLRTQAHLGLGMWTPTCGFGRMLNVWPTWGSRWVSPTGLSGPMIR